MDKSGHQGGLQQQQQSHSTPSDGGNMRCSATDMQQSMNFNSSSSRVGPFNSSNSGGAAPAIGRNRYDSEGSTGSGGKAVDSNRNMQLAFKVGIHFYSSWVALEAPFSRGVSSQESRKTRRKQLVWENTRGKTRCKNRKSSQTDRVLTLRCDRTVMKIIKKWKYIKK